MMHTWLPANSHDFLKLSWMQVKPYFDELEGRTLDAGTLAAWMADWARVGKLLDESYWYLWVQTTLDTRDPALETRFITFLSAIHEHAQTAEQRLKRKLLDSGLKPDRYDAPLRNLRAEADLFRPANLPLLTEEHRLGHEYDRIRAGQTVTWNGVETSLVQLALALHEPDRALREQAWRLSMARTLQDRAALNDLWTQLMPLRGQIAANAGLPDYRAYRWGQMLRLDYTPADCETFHRSIEAVVVPAAERALERRRVRLGVDSIRPWDVDVDPPGSPPLYPFQSVEELAAKAETVLECLDPQLAEYFRVMRREGLLDLDNRPGKMPSSYCATYPVRARPFLFMNVVGTHEDVVTLFHELGHAFHAFENARLPYHDQMRIGTEFHEVAAITMELLAAPYLVEGGFYTPHEAAHARVTHLETMLRWWPYIAVVDAFQHWAYTHADAACDPAECDAAWADLWARFMRGEDWRGLDDAMTTGWQRKLHIFRNPFYYIDYGLAQLGAVQIWARAQHDEADAIARYKHALSLGGTVSLPKLYEAAGARLAFDADTFAAAVAVIERAIAELDTGDAVLRG